MIDRIKLVIQGVAEIVGSDDVSLITLTDEQQLKQLSVVCDKTTARQISMRIGKAPLTSIMLPEVLCRLMGDMDSEHFEVLINDLVDGQYRAMLIEKPTLKMTPIRVSDALLLAMVAGLDVYIVLTLMRRQAVDYKGDARGISIPVNTLSMKMLEEALDNAINDENYELASQLRDEMKRRR